MSLEVNPLFADNMVLQRGKAIKVWGSAPSDDTITIAIGEQKASARSINGLWTASLPPMEAANATEMKISSKASGEMIVIRNVAIGEVWIAGGQSNMEFLLKFDAEAEQAIAAANNPHIRFYDTPKTSYRGQELEEDFSAYGFWRVCDAENAVNYSAVGYYFAQQLYLELQVPIGIVGCNWGGTTASTWLDETFLSRDEDLQSYLNEYENVVSKLDIQEYERKFKLGRQASREPEAVKFMDQLLAGDVTHEQFVERMKQVDLSLYLLIGPKYMNRPGGLYHGMVSRIIGFAARGVIWYQGESDDIKAHMYEKLFTAVIQCWREAWQEELPFLFVQLAPFGSWPGASGQSFPILREQQENVSKNVSQAYMASIMDAVLERDIHPKYKRPVGERLALLARGKVYGQQVICESPEVKNAILEGDQLRLTFKHTGDGMIVKGDAVAGIQLFAGDEKLADFKVFVQGDAMDIQCQGLKDKDSIEVRFAWTAFVQVNVYSSVGLPLKPFKLTLLRTSS